MPDVWLAFGFVASTSVTAAVLVISRRVGLFDIPNRRSSHDRPIPRVGGVGIAAGSALGIVLSSAISDWRVGAVALGALAMAVVGLTDDLRPMRAAIKLGLQFAVAAAVVLAVRPDWLIDMPGFSVMGSSWIGFVAAVIWVVAVCNAVNFMDGINGLAAASITVAAVVASVFGGSAGSGLFLAVASAAAGFLVWNWHPASIFMGDSGSQFLGFVLGAGLLISADGMPAIPALLLLAPLLLDAGVTLVIRAVRRERLFEAHRDHLYQRLSDSYGQPRVAAGYALASAISGGAAVVYSTTDDLMQGGILGLCVLVVSALVVTQRHRWLTP